MNANGIDVLTHLIPANARNKNANSDLLVKKNKMDLFSKYRNLPYTHFSTQYISPEYKMQILTICSRKNILMLL